MPLKRLIILLSALLVISPLMSQLAMASASHPMRGMNISEKVAAVSSNYSCSDQIAGQACSNTTCQCNADITVLFYPFDVNPAPASSMSRFSPTLQNPPNRVTAVIVPPPITSL